MIYCIIDNIITDPQLSNQAKMHFKTITDLMKEQETACSAKRETLRRDEDHSHPRISRRRKV